MVNVDFTRLTSDALDRYENGKFREMNEEDFIAELEKW